MSKESTLNLWSFPLPFPCRPLPPWRAAGKNMQPKVCPYFFFTRSFFYILLCKNLVSLSQIGIEGAAIARTGGGGSLQTKKKTKQKKKRVPLPHQPHRQRPWTTQLVYDALEAGIMTS